MNIQRFGNKLKMPSMLAIKHELLLMMLDDEIASIQPNEVFAEDKSPAIAILRRLNLLSSARTMPIASARLPSGQDDRVGG